MWRKLALITALVWCARAQNGISNATSGPWTAELNGAWRWHVGDDLRWAAPSYDDSSWQSLSIPGPPPNARHYWIRIPVLLGQVTDPGIMIGGIAYGYELYWDGERIGNLGHDAPDTQWFTPRPLIFSIPVHLATSGHHVIAVRVFDGRTRLFVGAPKLLARQNQVGSFSVLNAIETADWSALIQVRSTELLIDLVLALVGVYFLLLPRSTAGGLTFRWFGACLLFRGLFVLCQFYEHLGPPVIPAGILDRITMTNFVLSFIFAIDFVFAMFRRKVPTRIRGVQALNVAAVLIFQIDPAAHLSELLAVAGATSVVISIIGAALAAMEFRRRSPGAGVTFALFTVWLFVTSSYLANEIFHLPVPTGIEFSGLRIRLTPPLIIGAGYFVGFWDASLFLWIPIMAFEIHRINERFQRERARLSGEMEAARQVQDLLLPSQSIHAPGFEIDASYHPATEVGGDFFQIFPAANGSLLLIVGDVSGKGMKAALLVSLIVGALRNRRSDQPSCVLSELNAVLLGPSEGGFTTCCCALFASDDTVTLANAGHLSPYRNGEEIATPPGVPLGLTPAAEWEETQLKLEPGDRLLWLSDGVIEARNGKRELLGFERAQQIAGRPAAEISRAAQAFGQEDDITVVSITRQRVAAYVA